MKLIRRCGGRPRGQASGFDAGWEAGLGHRRRLVLGLRSLLRFEQWAAVYGDGIRIVGVQAQGSTGGLEALIVGVEALNVLPWIDATYVTVFIDCPEGWHVRMDKFGPATPASERELKHLAVLQEALRADREAGVLQPNLRARLRRVELAATSW